MLKFIEKFLGDPKKKDLIRLETLTKKVNKQEEEIQHMSNDEFSVKIQSLKGKNYKTSEHLLIEMVACAKNACRRLDGTEYEVFGKKEIWNMIPFDVQIIGVLALLEGKIAEMRTGEGKTLVAGMAASVAAFSGKGVHVVTVNDYLAKRDRESNLPLFEKMGHEKVGVVVHGIDNSKRKEAYGSDITYGTNNEFGFDYLRDNMARTEDALVQRDLYFAIVDEVDSILIDESRTPLIISAPAGEDTGKYTEYGILVKQLENETHYTIDEKQKTAILTEEGVRKMEEYLKVDNIYTAKGFKEVHHIEQALRATTCFQKDKDYVVDPQNGVVIVDEFTGRLMPGRRFSDGLHQALEAKENVEVRQQSKTLASITFQNYFRLYDQLSGMTGTAETEEEEFGNIYGLLVLPIPTNKPIKRKDKKDVIYKNENGKFFAIAKAVKEKNTKGQPVLIGTASIEKSEILSHILKAQGIPHEVLNAKHHEREAEIIAAAGQHGAITIATNMAGRGTDIKLGEGVEELGGLSIIGSERHESRRIDNQLRGRCGRQGDNGETQFFVSLEDSLMRMFGSDKMIGLMNAMNIPEDLPIENGIISKGIENAQKRVEGLHFDRRKHVLQYDNVMSRHRDIIYDKRRKLLGNTDLHGEFLEMIREEVENIIEVHTAGRQSHKWNIKEIHEDIMGFHKSDELTLEQFKKCDSTDEMSILGIEYLNKHYEKKREQFLNHESAEKAECQISLRVIDTLFMEHIQSMTRLKEQVSLQAYGQRNPLMEYKKEGFHAFTKLIAEMRKGRLMTFFHIRVETKLPEIKEVKMITNEDEIEKNLSGTTSSQSQNSNANQNRPRPQPIRVPSQASPQAVARQILAKPKTTAPAGVTVIRVEDDEKTKYDGPKTGRNDSCPCGSGKKFKKCCGAN